MELTEYLSTRDQSQRDFAAEIGVAHETVNRWIKGHRSPRPAMLRRIAAVTGGAVREADFPSVRGAPRTRLAEYLAAHRTTQREFAGSVGVAVETVASWVSGARIPRRAQMARIVAVTGGAVRPGDFYPDGDKAEV